MNPISPAHPVGSSAVPLASFAMAQELNDPNNDDWGTQLTDLFVGFIDTVKAKTTGPVLMLVRALVFGFLILTVGVAALILFLVGLVRLINVYLPEEVWATYLLLGTIFTVAGLFLWSKRRA